MDEDVLKQARDCKFTRSALRALAAQLPSEDEVIDRLLAQAVSARDELAFTHLVIAALEAGRKVDARHLAEGAALLPNLGNLGGVALRMQGDVCQGLLGAVGKGGMGREREALALIYAAAWCKEQGGGTIPPALISRARTLARSLYNNELAQVEILGLADMIQDNSLMVMIESVGCPKGDLPNARQLVKMVLERAKESLFTDVPEESRQTVISGYTVRRAVPRIGRNDPCPCGSGKKYKQCCLGKDEERSLKPSSVPGMTYEELRLLPELHLTEDRLLDMRSYELARLDPGKVSADLLPLLTDQLLLFHEFEAVVKLFEKVGCPKALNITWQMALRQLTDAAQVELVRRLLQTRPELAEKMDELDFGARLLLAGSGASPITEMVEAEALSALRNEDPVHLVDMAYSLLASRYPALGILVARGVVPVANHFDATMLLDALEETRDKLSLFTPEPLVAVHEQRFSSETAGNIEDTLELADARLHLSDKNEELRKLKSELDALHKELEKREKRAAASVPPPVQITPPQTPPQAPSAPTEDRALAELRNRVESLREDLKQRHNERNQLRRELQDAMRDNEALRQKASQAPPAPSAEAAPDEDLWLMPEESLGSQPVRIPEFPKKFTEVLSSLPKQVSHAAMLLIGRLAAGEAAAYAGVKRLQALHHVLRQRVGADYRLLFSLKPGLLEVIALINRRDLERKIKSLM